MCTCGRLLYGQPFICRRPSHFTSELFRLLMRLNCSPALGIPTTTTTNAADIFPETRTHLQCLPFTSRLVEIDRPTAVSGDDNSALTDDDADIDVNSRNSDSCAFRRFYTVLMIASSSETRSPLTSQYPLSSRRLSVHVWSTKMLCNDLHSLIREHIATEENIYK